VYRALEATGLTERLVAMDQAGARVTVFYEGARAPDPRQPADLATAMGLARRLHAMGLKTGPRFALDQQVHRYERLCANLPPPPYPHLDRQRARARELASRLSQKHTTEVLCHCDMVADNILILPTGRALLIDWEYAALADPLIDVAGLCMGSFLERPQAAEALRVYLRREPLPDESARLALHLAVAGYAWALWAHWQAQTRPGARDAAAYAAYGAATYRFALEYSGLVA
jgi:thiamine kinase-like enzyme